MVSRPRPAARHLNRRRAGPVASEACRATPRPAMSPGCGSTRRGSAHAAPRGRARRLFDERRIWSFHLHRDGEPRAGGGTAGRLALGAAQVPRPARPGCSWSSTSPVRSASTRRSTSAAAPAGSRSSTTPASHSASTSRCASRRPSTPAARSTSRPLLDAIDEVLTALKDAGVDAVPRLRDDARRGARRPPDRSRQRRRPRLRQRARAPGRRDPRVVPAAARSWPGGLPITRYSALAFKVDVVEGDGVGRAAWTSSAASCATASCT